MLHEAILWQNIETEAFHLIRASNSLQINASKIKFESQWSEMGANQRNCYFGLQQF